MFCHKCKIYLINEKTNPWCLKCSHCPKKHLLQLLPNCSLPKHCQECNLKEYIKEIDFFIIRNQNKNPPSLFSQKKINYSPSPSSTNIHIPP